MFIFVFQLIYFHRFSFSHACWEFKKNQFPFKHISFSARVFGATEVGMATPAVRAASKGAEPRNPQLCKLVNRTLIYFQSGG